MTAAIDGTLRAWELAAGLRPHRTWSAGGRVRAMVFHPDGRSLLTAQGASAQFWDAASGAPSGPSRAYTGQVQCVALSPDGKIVLTATSAVKKEGNTSKIKREVYRWDRATGAAPGKLFEVADQTVSMRFLSDGRRLATISSADRPQVGFRLHLHDASTGQPLGDAVMAAQPPDPRSSVETGMEATGHLMALGPMRGDILFHQAAILSRDETRVLGFRRLGTVAGLWDFATGQPAGPPAVHPDWVTAVAFRPDGRVFATGCRDRAARLWDATTGAPIGQPMENTYTVTALEFSPDGRTLLTGGMDAAGATGGARLWDAASGQPLTPPLTGGHPVTAVAFRPDGQAIAIADTIMNAPAQGADNVSIWTLPAPEPGDIDALRRKVQVWTGLELRDADRFQALAPEDWQSRAKQLEAAGDRR